METVQIRLAGTALLALLPGIITTPQAYAQDAPQPVVYSAYYECDPTRLAGIDSLVRSSWAPIFDRQVTAGNATAWGWIMHHTGSTWSRGFYVIAPDVGKVVAAIESLGRDADPRLMQQTSASCPRHEDYIWQRVAGSQPAAQLGANRPAATLSIYYECSQGREERADALLASAFAPVFNAAVERGDVASWGWLQHLVGGKYRRLLVSDGRDATAVLNAIARISSELRAQQNNAYREFHEICPSHQDVVWSIMAR